MRYLTLLGIMVLAIAGCTKTETETVYQCLGGSTQCGPSCVDLDSDNLNCGACGTACDPGMVCSVGTCAATCEAGLTDCSSSCRNVLTDPDNCGACRNVCPLGTCREGTCVRKTVAFVSQSSMAAQVSDALFDKVIISYPMDTNDYIQMMAADVVVLGRYAYQWSVITPDFRRALERYSRAGGNIMNEWDGLSFFLDGYHTTYTYATGAVAPLNWFNGTVGAGGWLAANTPISWTNTADPIFQGMTSPLSGGDATEFFFTTYNTVDTELEVLATFEGNGSTAFPTGPHPTILRGARCGGNVLFFTADLSDSPASVSPLVGNAVIAAAGRGTGTTDDVCPVCGDGVLQPGEDLDPAPGPYTYAPVSNTTCRYDFSGMTQLYCSGTCTWGGDAGCDQADADIFCKLKTANPFSTASAFTTGTSSAAAGFSCPTYGTNLGPMPVRGVNVDVWYQDTSILANHGAGTVISSVTCTNP